MSSAIDTTAFSVLDRSRVREGHSAGEALRDSVALAREAEALGYHRFWVAEHHGVPGVAGAAPLVLATAVAGATERIRVGTGGVMLPNHRPFVVAEQFGVLAGLHPGRTDLGLGRSVGFTNEVRRALGHDKEDAALERFGEQLAELRGWFDGTQSTYRGVHAVTAEGLRPPFFVLATGRGAGLAARAGLPLVIAAVRGEDELLRTLDAYRADFRPSPGNPEPYVVLSGTVAVAGTAEEARRLLLPEAYASMWSRTRGVFPPLVPAEEIEGRTLSERERPLYEEALRGHVAGTEEEVAAELERLLTRTGADEYLVTTSTYDRAALVDSYRRLARLTGLAGRTGQ
ncbi:LLM class flavin-dependent oxidoreductase [Streptomyces sp. NRRL F-5630]|uniref:LLM class flavin-dependent oxidoreductase n=1 Tax=Streptomyces sp. NRRL F-5630 TaxID=1463864 RepID=UPI003EC13A52